MNNPIPTLVHSHNLPTVAIAAVVCIVGSILAVRLIHRYRSATGQIQRLYLCMIGLVAGSTVWATHFIAMLAYHDLVSAGYDLVRTGFSLVIAWIGTFAAAAIFKKPRLRRPYIAAGLLLGLTISAMHYYGIAGYQIAGQISLDLWTVVISVVLSIVFSIAAFHRIAHPITRYCWIGGAILMSLAICVLHFVGMSAIEIKTVAEVALPKSALSQDILLAIVVSVVAILLLLGFGSFSIDTRLTNESRSQAAFWENHDRLTGLPNRKQMNEMLDATASHLANDAQFQSAILLVDLNLFKNINDLYGHRVGDVVLQEVAARLQSRLEQSHLLARVGGDEFVAIIPNPKDVEAVANFAEQLHAAIARPVIVDGVKISVFVTIGVATTHQNERNPEELLQRANSAVQRGKQTSLAICVFDPEIDIENRDELQLMNDLRTACENGELELAYQLQNDIDTLEPIGFEALLRWNHPERGRLMPGTFIAIAEKTGIIRDIGLWVLETACIEAASWDKPLNIAINVAPQQLAEPRFVSQVQQALGKSGLSASRLELEVTEEGFISDMEQTLTVMLQLKEIGVRIAMDDFGTGYSSLSMLQSFPFDKIKIDRSFVQDVHLNSQRAAIIRSTLVLGEALQIPVLAEGVETSQELQFLQAAGCTTVQGYYFGKPLAWADMREVVTKVDTSGSERVLRLPISKAI